LRRLGGWLLGLYVLAQCAGILPLIVTHLQHEFASHQHSATIEGLADRGHALPGHHEHGSADPSDQCCTLHHHLAATFFAVGGASLPGFVAIAVALPPSRSLLSADDRLPERPPKLPLPV
jgi:hypothetical protein